MISVGALTSGKNTPSARYRVRQHISSLLKYGVDVTEYCPLIEKNTPVPYLGKFSPKYYLPLYFMWQSGKLIERIPSIVASHKHDAVWLNKELLTGYSTLERFLKKPIFFDVDDAIWLNPPFKENAIKKIASCSEVVICGNEVIADWFSSINKKTVVIPTAVDTKKYHPHVTNKDIVTLGWVGTHGNLKYLDKIINPILSVLKKYENVEFLVVSDRPPSFLNASTKIRYLKWSPIDDEQYFKDIDIGLMPLFPDEWSEAKCSYKMLQHFSCGKPAIATPVGLNKTILEQSLAGLPANSVSDWFDALTFLLEHDDSRSLMGVNGRAFVEKYYSCTVVQKQLTKVFNMVKEL